MNYPKAYEGNEPYIFISYAHKNSDLVLPIVEALQQQGYRIWYDGGIEAGTEWAEYIAEKVVGCRVFLAFLSQAAIDSKNCRNEINMALEEKCEPLVVHIEDVTLSPGMRLQLGSVQHLFRARYENDVAFLADLFTAKILQPCLGQCGQSTPADDNVKVAPAPTTPVQPAKKRVCKLCGYAVTDPALTECPVCGNPYADRPKTPQEQAAEYLEQAQKIEKMFGNTEEELKEMFSLYKKAADLRDPDGIFLLGFCYNYGKGIPQSDQKAFELLKKAADLGEYRAQYMVGEFYEQGRYVEIDLEAAIRYYEPSAAKGHPSAILALERCRDKVGNGQTGMLIAQGRKLYEQGGNNDKAFFCFRRAAELGDPCGQYFMAILSELGVGTAADIDAALALYEKAAATGEETYTEALELCRRRKASTAEKCCRDGFLAETGIGTFGQAPLWYRRAMALGSLDGQAALGVCYRDGKGVPKDPERALSLLTDAAQKQNPKGCCELGRAYLKGSCGVTDAAKAVQYFRFAADRGYAEAQFELGECYREGKGVPQNRVTAIAWYHKAAEQGNMMARFMLKKL